MKEIPIIFSSEMVKAILEGKKTQTRRVITKANSVLGPGGDWTKLDFNGQAIYKDTPFGFDLKWLEIDRKAPLPWVDGKPETGQYLHVPYNWDEDMTIYRVYSKYEVGDRLWVKESWWEQAGDIYYKADWLDNKPVNMVYDGGKWKSSLFMPRWASRILLEIKEIRVERLQEITVGDCHKEGVPYGSNVVGIRDGSVVLFEFKQLWDSINGKKHPWEANDWVWIIGFTLIADRE